MNAGAKAAEIASRKHQMLLEEAQSAIERRPSIGQISSSRRFAFLLIIVFFIYILMLFPLH